MLLSISSVASSAHQLIFINRIYVVSPSQMCDEIFASISDKQV